MDWHCHLPSHWKLVPLRYVAELGTGHTPDRTKPEYWVDCDIPWVTAADLSGRASEFEPLLETAQHVSALGVANSAAVVHPAETVMFCRTASVGLLTITGRPMATTQAFVTWSPGPRLLSRYLLYALAAMRPELSRIAYGSTHLTIYMPDLEALRVPLPPLEEQRRIADFLDDHVARLDRAIALRQRAVDLTKAKRWATWLDQIKGTDSSRVPLRRVLLDLADGPFGSAFTSADYTDTGARVIRLGNIGFAEYRAEEEAFIPMSIWAQFPRCHVHAGELLIAGLGDERNHAGRACVAPDLAPALVKGKCFRAQVDENLADPRFVALMLSSPLGAELLAIETRGSTRSMINLEIVKSITVPLPPVEKQRRMVERFSTAQDKLDRASALQQKAQRLLEERKQALITAAVTGQFDVTTARAMAS